ncbi:ADP-ribose pyrophosphatase [Candidatus Erwinia dacicola]|uniref:ADP-ribose pyrophosphatase n=1 Tax=Candidatus Erwinia dacicola TaxID=252393 RepID=A0A328TRB7_9GAMM|nr:ADP-ribose pyrophosphatase [Candidatus Erwinia dacicola]
MERGHAGVLLPYDPLRDEVVLIEEISIAAYDTSPTPWVVGMMEPGETPEEVARREALEEAGLTPGRIKPIINSLSSAGGTTERLSMFVGEVDASVAQGNHDLEEENEDILVWSAVLRLTSG